MDGGSVLRKAATYTQTTHTEYRKPMPRVGFESVFEQTETVHALNRAAIVIAV
jgi:hypothetical protein